MFEKYIYTNMTSVLVWLMVNNSITNENYKEDFESILTHIELLISSEQYSNIAIYISVDWCESFWNFMVNHV